MIELGSFTPDLLKRKEIVQEVREFFLKKRNCPVGQKVLF